MAGKGSRGAEGSDGQSSLADRLASLEKSMSTLLLRFGEQEQELLSLSQIVMAMQAGGSAPVAAPPVPAAAPPGPAAPRLPLSPAMGNVLKLIFTGQAEEAKQALGAIPAEERKAQPAVLALAAAALYIARDDAANARTALAKARELTDDARLLRIVEAIAAKVPAA